MASPIGRIKIWPVEATIWKNDKFYSVTASKTYKDGDEYKTTTNFDRDDLLKVAKAIDMAHTWIVKQEEKEREQPK